MYALDENDGPIRVEDIGRHVGPARRWYKGYTAAAHQAALAGQEAIRQFAQRFLPKVVAHPHNLRLAAAHVARKGGDTPGPDGLTCRDLTRAEMFKLLRRIEKDLKGGSYQHGPVRRVRIPKGRKGGWRTIVVANVDDRIVSRAIVQVLQPLLDPGFDGHSFCRPKRSRLHALARAEFLMQHLGRRTWITEDIRDAFGQVPIARLLDVLRKWIPVAALVDLVVKVIADGSGKGLRQGAALSPLMMELYLSWFLDRVWRRLHPEIALLRYMDDVLVVCGPKDDAAALYADLKRILRDAGLALKGKPGSAIHYPGRGKGIPWLGFVITLMAEGIEAGLPWDDENDGVLDRLRGKLLRAHSKPDAPLRAVKIINAFLAQAGPCYPHEDRRGIYQRITAAARDLAFEELPSRDDFEKQWSEAYQRWCKLRGGMGQDPGIGCSPAHLQLR